MTIAVYWDVKQQTKPKQQSENSTHSNKHIRTLYGGGIITADGCGAMQNAEAKMILVMRRCYNKIKS